MIYTKYFLFTLLLAVSLELQAQTFGVRAGLNNGTLQGPTENSSEEFGFNGGFHFGVNYGYNVSDLLSIMVEVGYTQYGTRQSYNGDSYFIIRDDERTIWERGNREMELSISNGYLSFPVVVNYKLTKKWEIFAGAYANILVSPTGRGQLRFTSEDNPDDIIFVQSLDYNYRNDMALEGRRITGQRDIGVFDENGEVIFFPKIAGAYYQHSEKAANLINGLDAGLVTGFNYFLNKGFYAGLRVEYGLTDVTDDRVDASLAELDAQNSLIYRDDKDHHLGINVSIGFRF